MTFILRALVRRLFYAVVVLGILFVGANLVLEPVAESQLASAIRSSFDLDRRPVVKIDAFPIIVRILQGRIPHMTVTASNVAIDRGFVVAALAIDLFDLHASLDVLTKPKDADVTVARGKATAEMTETAVNAYLRSQAEDARVQIRDGSVVVRLDRVFAGRRRHLQATGTVALSSRRLSFKARRVTIDGDPPPPPLAARAKREASFSVLLPELPGGIVPTTVDLRAGRATFVAVLRGYRLKLSG